MSPRPRRPSRAERRPEATGPERDGGGTSPPRSKAMDNCGLLQFALSPCAEAGGKLSRPVRFF